MATSVKLSSKNQIVVPKEARRALGVGSGSRLLIIVRPDGGVEMQPEPVDIAADLEGILRTIGGAEAGLWEELRLE
ncbi:MAG: AbrB/MazE/SpoVT family DNA-binding domain-containing protein [Gemmatimonadota bacterium]